MSKSSKLDASITLLFFLKYSKKFLSLIGTKELIKPIFILKSKRPLKLISSSLRNSVIVCSPFNLKE